MGKITDRLKQLRILMEREGMDMYLVPTADFHQSEFVGEYFSARAYMSGFSGSAGVLLVEKEAAHLWVDGRYFVQAEKELEGSTIQLMKMGEEGVPSLEDFIIQEMPQKGCLGVDGRVIAARQGVRLEQLLQEKGAHLSVKKDLVGEIWKDRSEISKKQAFLLDVKYAGESRQDKIAWLREEMRKEHADVHVLTSLDDIAWLLNIRGRDIPCNPVVLSYLVLTQTELAFFVHKEAMGEKVTKEFTKEGITVYPYDEVYHYVNQMPEGSKVLLDTYIVNYALMRAIRPDCEVKHRKNPTTIKKAVKNPVEQENVRIAHLKDAKAMCRFIYWLKTHVEKETITEMQAAEYVNQLRLDDPDCHDVGFTTIAAYGPNAAMCHYHPTAEDCAVIEPKGLFLLDSGGQYWQGTTDVTRTIVVGDLTQEEKESFTLVLQGHIRLAMTKFLYGTCGNVLDYAARSPLWERGLDFKHGTGHGVGYFLNVHEGPNNFRHRLPENKEDLVPLEAGMLTSNEPGLYIEGKYGIRTENLVFCQNAEKNEFGQFMELETVTFVPIDRDAILPEMLSSKELAWLNEYHRQVYEKVAPLVNEEERQWLKEATAEIK
ncbi:MAG: aminopeptidase P family protein [Lachnospiraceae bacterium]|jgi:Xaa-Pro aminopeptidase